MIAFVCLRRFLVSSQNSNHHQVSEYLSQLVHLFLIIFLLSKEFRVQCFKVFLIHVHSQVHIPQCQKLLTKHTRSTTVRLSVNALLLRFFLFFWSFQSWRTLKLTHNFFHNFFFSSTRQKKWSIQLFLVFPFSHTCSRPLTQSVSQSHTTHRWVNGEVCSWKRPQLLSFKNVMISW